ncbi:MAG: tRNA pseudouridine(55) synthase TruB [Phycisphaerae bacterium]|nr:tRNA pseudouridine(55) synthase TruB [Phycisphaerae bacterium]
MDGIINLYKPPELTSAKALYRVRKITGQRKSGHAGTLDPAAEGVLVLCLGRATKLVEQLMDQPKVYRTTARLDVTSRSFDSEDPLLPVLVAQPPPREQVVQALAGFEGTIAQVPPAISAVKVGGRPAYKLSRAGKAPLLKPRPIQIYWIHVWKYDWPRLDFEVACGRGTYIRALIRDIGARLGTGGCLTTLIRRAVGPFQAQQSWSLMDLERAGDPGDYLLPLEEARNLLAERPAQVPPRPLRSE